MVDAIEALGDVGIQHELRLLLAGQEYGPDRVPTGPPRPEPITVRLEPGLPLRFECEPNEGLQAPIA